MDVISLTVDSKKRISLTKLLPPETSVPFELTRMVIELYSNL